MIVRKVLSLLLLAGSSLAQEAVYPDAQPVLTSENGELTVTLTIGEALYTEFNEGNSTGLVQKVMGYNGIMGGPTLRVKPGDTLRITLQNNLPPEPCNTSVPEMWNQYHAIDATNLHVHGLFVPAETNNISMKIWPGESHEYVIPIPEGHQGGTHWYHPHVQGASTHQAGGGALGLIVVEDLDADVPEEVANLPEVNLRMQFLNFTYLQYDYSTGQDYSYITLCNQFCVPEANRGNCSEPFWQHGPNMGDYNTSLAPDGYEYEYLLVNGVKEPEITLTAGQWYRFRTLYVPTRNRNIEPHISEDDCDFLLLAKDGKYMPVTPRKIHSGFMYSGSRADFLVRCNIPGRYLFESLNNARDSSEWIPDQQRYSLRRTIAHLNVVAGPTARTTDIPVFKVARPCYMPDMLNVPAEKQFYFIMAALNPPDLGEGEVIPADRPSWESGNISYYSINDKGLYDAPTIEYMGVKDDSTKYDFELSLGSIWEIDFYVPQIHPLHMHIFPHQVVKLPSMPIMEDYFKVGDYHDVTLLPISDVYEKAVLRTHVTEYATDILVHCHMYRHTDHGMLIAGRSIGTEGTVSEKVEGTCYLGLEGRGYELVMASGSNATGGGGGVTEDHDSGMSATPPPEEHTTGDDPDLEEIPDVGGEEPSGAAGIQLVISVIVSCCLFMTLVLV